MRTAVLTHVGAAPQLPAALRERSRSGNVCLPGPGNSAVQRHEETSRKTPRVSTRPRRENSKRFSTAWDRTLRRRHRARPCAMSETRGAPAPRPGRRLQRGLGARRLPRSLPPPRSRREEPRAAHRQLAGCGIRRAARFASSPSPLSRRVREAACPAGLPAERWRHRQGPLRGRRPPPSLVPGSRGVAPKRPGRVARSPRPKPVGLTFRSARAAPTSRPTAPPGRGLLSSGERCGRRTAGAVGAAEPCECGSRGRRRGAKGRCARPRRRRSSCPRTRVVVRGRAARAAACAARPRRRTPPSRGGRGAGLLGGTGRDTGRARAGSGEAGTWSCPRPAPRRGRAGISP